MRPFYKELQERLDVLTRPVAAWDVEPLPATDGLGCGQIAEALDQEALDLIWDQAETFADPPNKGFEDEFSASSPPAPSAPMRFSVLEHIRNAGSEVVIISPYLIPVPIGMETIRHAPCAGRQGQHPHKLAGIDRPAAGACRL